MPQNPPQSHPLHPHYTRFPPPSGNTPRRIPFHLGELAIIIITLLFLLELFLVLGRRLAKPLLGRETRSLVPFSAHGRAGLTRVEVGWVLVVLLVKAATGPVVGWMGLEGWVNCGVGIRSAGGRREMEGGSTGADDADGSSAARTAGSGKRSGSESAGLRITGPELHVEVPIRITRDDIDAFIACLVPGTLAGTVERSQPLLALFLSAVSSPTQLLLLAKRQCPVKPLGAVNVRNRFEVLQPGRCRDLWTGDCRDATAKARLGEKVRARKRGLEFDLVVEVFLSEGQGEKEGEEMVVFRQIFTVLQFQKHGYPVEAPQEDYMGMNEGVKSVPFGVGKKDPGLWAVLCKDYNPIHTSGIAAKVFGLPGRIAHGNCVVAKAWAAIESEDHLSRVDGSVDGPMFVEVAFKRPVNVPSEVGVKIQRDSRMSTFQVMLNAKVHVEGRSGLL